jgi:hypothetical protein
MAQLVFQSVSGGTTTLNGTNTAGTYNLTVPAANGTLLYQDLSGLIIFNNVNITGQLSLTGNGAFKLPVGNTAQRPSPEAGDIRYNTDGGGLYEVYLPALSAWQKMVTTPIGNYTITYVVVGGGGGGSNGGGTGGGGAGQFIASTLTAIPGTLFTMTIGAGGAAQSLGATTSITGVVNAVGGGAGGNPTNTAASSGGASGNGYSGGFGLGSAGGGGSSASTSSNSGGAGTTTLIQGGSNTYAGGGGGGASTSFPGNQGSGAASGGGGGDYTASPVVNPGNGNPNTGSGGGGSALNAPQSGGNGGSGIAILRMPTASYTATFTGSPTVLTSGTDTVLVYNSSGTYTA